MKKLLISAIILSQTIAPAFSETTASFNLAGVIENIINYQTSAADFTADIEINSKDNFLSAMQNMNNGNVVVSYTEFKKAVESLDKNMPLLMLSKKLYEFGFFDLGDEALLKASNNENLKTQINLLKEAYKPSYKLSKDEETYLAKAYTQIYYNNSPEEAAFNLIKKTVLLENSDYANYIMANAMFECKQYNQALIYVNKAIEKNPSNSNYKLFKAKVLVEKGQMKETIKYIDEIKDNIAIFFVDDLKILEQKALYKNSDNETDKKFHQIYVYYLEGNYYKVLKETQNVLTFNKNNPKMLTLQGMAHLALNEKDKAQEDFLSSYKYDKKADLTLMGMADINFINGSYKEAEKIYKKLINSNFKKEAIVKLSALYEVQNIKDKKADKIYKLRDTFAKNAFFEYYLLANNIFYNDETNKEKYLAKSLNLNALSVNSWDIILASVFKNKDFTQLNKLVFMLSFLDLKNPEYYYYSALCMDNFGNKKSAFYEAKKSILISPEYKPAQELISRLESELI